MADMQTISPSADRLGAALRALRQTHTQDGDDKASLGAKCLHVVIAELAAEGVSQEDLKPLADLEAFLASLKTQGDGETRRNRRRGSSPSSIFLARIAAVVDLLVKAGYDESEAAQLVMRRLIAAGVPPPAQGGDARGWRRLLESRTEIVHGIGPEEVRQEYQAFTREIEAIPASERVKRVLDERLWDRRRKPR
jgi:hypothetical protein